MMMIGAVGFRFVRGIIKSAVLSSNESTWDYWQRSMSKTDIVCMYDKGNDVLLTLGEIKLVMTMMMMVMIVTMMMMVILIIVMMMMMMMMMTMMMVMIVTMMMIVTTMVTVMMVTMMTMMMMMMMIAHDECYDVFVLIMMMIIDYDFYDNYD